MPGPTGQGGGTLPDFTPRDAIWSALGAGRSTIPAMIALEAVKKSFAGRVILPGLDLVVAERSSVALLGPSGCGKSTILKLVLGLLAPDSGSVTVAGTPVTRASAPALRALRRKIGYVIQDGGLFPHLTAAENATLVARELGWDSERQRARLDELTALARLSPALLARYPAELSGGERQRVGLVRALMLDPEVLLLDEPMSALDPVVRARLREDMRRAFDELHKTVLLVTHDLAEADALTDEVALLSAGRVLQRGPLRDLVAAPADEVVAEFVRAQRGPAS